MHPNERKYAELVRNSVPIADRNLDKKKSVLYTAQELTEKQQAQARMNIGAAEATDVAALEETVSQIRTSADGRRFAEKVMLYYGYPNAINNSWDVNNSANIYKDYDVCIFGDGYWLPTHEAHAETVEIFSILKRISPETRIVGYVPIGVKNVGGDSNLPIKAGNFITSSEVRVLMATGAFMQFTDDAHCRFSARLLRGDILVTRTKGHTVVVLSDGAKAAEERQSMPTEYALGDRLLKNGSVGADVKQLQEALIRLGISCGDYGADGEFGDCTEMAVITYQKQHALEPDGEYGPLTHASLTAELERLENPAQENCVRIVGGNCYVRVQPNTEAEKLGVAHRDTLLPYQGETAVNGWLKVSFAGRDGWVSGKYGRICG